jgi:hypothetical protein
MRNHIAEQIMGDRLINTFSIDHLIEITKEFYENIGEIYNGVLQNYKNNNIKYNANLEFIFLIRRLCLLDSVYKKLKQKSPYKLLPSKDISVKMTYMQNILLLNYKVFTIDNLFNYVFSTYKIPPRKPNIIFSFS